MYACETAQFRSRFIQASSNMESASLNDQHEFRVFLGQVSSSPIHPSHAAITRPSSLLLEKNAKFEWREEHHKAFEDAKTALTFPLTPSQQGKPLLLYITSNQRPNGDLLDHEGDKIEQLV
ncbi:hypothetical protein Acr_28g0015290 [Actinidia rufa]|uniref:Reverse transcriptase/retrotransposon-derived protein RNase H-like domain-containing protein n=1 Tax=Actinidia rufa TaxID=165716 RepID=A0A7J0HDN4_9ERIC|nr:hypothetical protein Acr_28g0015290 [Actinidia rufa]